MGPIEVLMEEHRVIERMLRIMSEASGQIEAGKEVDVDLFEKTIDFIRNFADRCHHLKEENILYVLIEQRGIPKEGGPIGMMLQEHDIGRDYVRGMDEALRRYKAGDRSQAMVISRNAVGYINLLSQHIMKEDNILYPMGNRVMSDADRKTLLEKFEEVETKEMGQGVHERYHHIIEDLEGKTGHRHQH